MVKPAESQLKSVFPISFISTYHKRTTFLEKGIDILFISTYNIINYKLKNYYNIEKTNLSIYLLNNVLYTQWTRPRIG
jgi:hypothetical protein